MLKTGVLQTGKHSIRHIAHTRLQRQQGVGQSAGGHLLLKESDNILGDLARDIIRRTEWPGLVGQVCHNDGGDLIKTALHVCSANAVRYLADIDRRSVGRIWNRDDICHALQFQWLPRVQLHDNFLCLKQIGGGIADSGRGNDVAVFGDGQRFNNGDIHRFQSTRADKLGTLRKVHIRIRDLPTVDILAE